MVHHNLPLGPIPPLAPHFPALRELCIVSQGIEAICGLEGLRSLEVLWLCECRISRIQGLETLVNLKKLFLYSNRIDRIEGLGGLSQLEVLWLCDNKLTSIDGLGELPSLRTLWVCGNRIASIIRSSLEGVPRLEELNLADNAFANFLSLEQLAALPDLQRLSFSDPLYGSNSLCELESYRVFALNRLPGLRFLDREEISERERADAQATFLRLKTTARARAHIADRETEKTFSAARATLARMLGAQNRKLNDLRLLLKELHREHFSATSTERGFAVPPRVAFDKDLTATKLQEEITRTSQALAELECGQRRMQELLSALRSELELDASRLKSRLLLERDSGGNVSIRESSGEDSRTRTVVDLIEARLFAPLATSSFKIRSVLRVSSAALALAFSGKGCHQEMLFLSSRRGCEFGAVLLNGFDAAAPGSFFTNSVNVALSGWLLPDQKPDSMCASFLIANFYTAADIFPTSRLRCQLFVCRVVLGNVKVDEGNAGEEIPDGYDAVCVSCATPMQRSYFLREKTGNALPEFLVEIDILPQEGTSAAAVSLLSGQGHLALEKERPSLHSAFNSACSRIADEMDGIQIPAEAHPTRAKFSDLHDDAICAIAGVKHVSSVTGLNLVRGEVSDATSLSRFSGLRVLVLAFNSIADVSPLVSLGSLEFLDLSHNALKRCNTLVLLPRLAELHLEHNLINDLEQLQGLSSAPSLASLFVAGNPVASEPWSRSAIAQIFPRIVFLDGELVERGEEDLSRLSVGDPPSKGELALSGLGIANLSAVPLLRQCTEITVLRLSGNNLRSLTGIEGCTRTLTKLFAEHNRIKDLAPLKGFSKLRRLEIGHNRVSSLLPLSESQSLTVLAVNDNLLSSLEGLQKLRDLKELYSPNNKLSTTRGIAPIALLQRLFLVDFSGNPICANPDYRALVLFKLRAVHVLDGKQVEPEEIAMAAEKFEGYFCDDDLEHRTGETAIEKLASLDISSSSIRFIVLSQPTILRLSSLRTLDVSCNELRSLDTAFLLPSLEVLRASSNKIESLSSGVAVQTLVELSLDSNKIKTIAALHLERFPSLRVLSVAGNAVTKLDGLEQAAPNLEVLNVEHNHVKSLSGIGGMVHLRTLRVGFCRINEVVEFDHLKNMKDLRELYVAGNGAVHKTHFIPSLLAVLPSLVSCDGKAITAEDRLLQLVRFL